MSLEVDVRENFHKEMPIHSNCLVSETIRTIPEGATMIAPSTIRRYLREECLFGRAAVKKLFIRQKNRKRRLAFAKDHKDWTKDDWNKVLWTNESKFELFGTNQRVYVRRRTGERLIDDCICPTVKHGSGNIMVWGSISGRGVHGQFGKNRRNNGKNGVS